MEGNVGVVGILVYIFSLGGGVAILVYTLILNELKYRLSRECKRTSS